MQPHMLTHDDTVFRYGKYDDKYGKEEKYGYDKYGKYDDK